jgi:uracil-DNA glycosylase
MVPLHTYRVNHFRYTGVMAKQEALAALEKEIAADTSLQLLESNLVFGEGNPDAKVLFIGEAPGERENELRRPFVGRAGQLLDKLIEELGWKRTDVYITNIVKRRPPGNRDPLPEEIEAYKPYLARQIEILKPALIAPLGRFSMNYFLPAAKITRDQGKLFRSGRWFIFPLLHPAAALRGTGALNSLRESFKKLPAAIAKCESLDVNSVPDASAAPAPKADGGVPPQSTLF